MKTVIASIVVFVAVGGVACGEAPEGIEQEEELGHDEQPYIYLDSATRQWGAQTGGNRLSCDKVSSGQTCTFARFKKIELARPNGWTADQKSSLTSAAGALQSVFIGWTFTVTDSSASPLTGYVRLLLSSGAVGGSLSNFIEGYRSVTFFSPVNLTEGQQAGLAAPVGNYQRHGSCSATIDFADADAKGTSSTQDQRIRQHALINAAEVCMGVGTRSDTPSPPTMSQRAISPAVSQTTATSGEVCRASISETTDEADISRQTASSCAD